MSRQTTRYVKPVQNKGADVVKGAQRAFATGCARIDNDRLEIEIVHVRQTPRYGFCASLAHDGGCRRPEICMVNRPSRRTLRAFSYCFTVPGSGGHFATLGIPMVDEPKTATEIARMIKERAYVLVGPWPVDLQLIIFSTTSGWRCGLSPASQTSNDLRYREAVLKIASELQSKVALVRDGASDTDTEDPPA
jgi:hypothetical protein